MTGGAARWLEGCTCQNVRIPDLIHAPPSAKPGLPTMDFEELVNTRRSVRGFKAEPVPRSVIEEIIEVAKRAPSSMNTQPWHVHVLTGEPLERVRQRNMEEMLAGAKPKRDIVSHGEYQGVHRGRQVDIAKQLFAVMGI